jgi:VanZ family protein
MFNRWSNLLWWSCVTLLSGILVTGLWPFNFCPRNRVHWLKAGDGLHFQPYGQAYSATLWTLNQPSESGDLSFTIELWLQPDETHHPQGVSIFSIHHPSDDHDLSIVQSGADLVLQGYFRDRNRTQQFAQMRFYGACRTSLPSFVTLTSSEEGTVLYKDAKPQPERYFLFPERYVGRIVLGHAPGSAEPWTGYILGLALYGRALRVEEIAQHYKDWLQHKPHLLQGAQALYVFDERTGNIVHNRSGSAPNLSIPATFMPLHPTILGVPHPFRLHRIDTVVNILGFIPIGFFLCAYLEDARYYSSRDAFAWTIILGALTSLGIELLQVFLPSRDSSLLDVINNVAGTTAGAFLQIRVHDHWREIVWRSIPGIQTARSNGKAHWKEMRRNRQ